MGRPIQTFRFYVYLMRRLTVKGRMRPLPIVMIDPTPNENLGLPAIFNITEINALILQRTPEPFNKNIVHPPTLAIHGDSNLMLFKSVGKRQARILASLVGVEYLGYAIQGYGLL